MTVSLHEYWSVESRVPPSEVWMPIHASVPMTEREADILITKYKRAMPLREYQKTARVSRYDPFDDEDIPF